MTTKNQMRLLLLALLLAISQIRSADGGTTAEWRRRVIYQVLTDRFNSGSSSPCSDLSTYCGGTFKGIIEKLDYIQDLGANAIWISPIPVNTPDGYHGYWAMDITTINPHFGSKTDLLNLVSACHARGIWVMLDVVANHMGNQRYGDWTNFTFFKPFNDQSHYHPYCQIKDWDDQEQVEVCRLANLPDLDQSNSFVRSTLKTWVEEQVKTFQLDGIRIDTVPEVPKTFWYEYTQSSGTFNIGEVFNGDVTYVAGYQGPLEALLNYPMYFSLKDVFQNKQPMTEIHNTLQSESSAFKDVTVLGMFLDNHDNARFLHNQGDVVLLYNGLAYILFSQGIPIIYYGTEQGFNGGNDPANRESLWPHFYQNNQIYKFISNLTHFRNKLDDSFYSVAQVQRYVDNQFYAYSRGKVFVATTNIGSGQSITRQITYHPYSVGEVLENVMNPNEKVTVQSNGFAVYISNGMPKVYYPVNGVLKPRLTTAASHKRHPNTGSDVDICSNTGCIGIVSTISVVVAIAVLLVAVVVVIKHLKKPAGYILVG